MPEELTTRERLGEEAHERPRRGELLTLDVDSLAYGGRGIARRNGYVVFVAGALPGDRVRAEVTKAKRGYAEASTVELVRESPDSLPPRCDHSREPCPGAPWQSLPYAQQLHHKQSQVEEALVRIGGLEGFRLE
jgi:23S rRNA (uracil1939-C5)-methyltransferase